MKKPISHGLAGYAQGHRCETCRAAKAEAWARYQPHRKRKPAPEPQKRDKDKANERLRIHRADKRGFQDECDHPPEAWTYHSATYERCTVCLKYRKRATRLEKAA